MSNELLKISKDDLTYMELRNELEREVYAPYFQDLPKEERVVPTRIQKLINKVKEIYSRVVFKIKIIRRYR